MYKKTILIIMCLFLFPSVFAFLPTEGLVASYDLNDNNFNGEVNDSGVTDYLGVNNGTYFGRTFNHGTNTGATYNNVTGTITGATWLDEGDCVRGTCLEFDGDGDYTESSLPLIKADITLSAWVKTNNNVDTQFIINKRSPSDARSHYGLRLSNGNNPEFYLTSDATDIQTGLYVSDPLEDNKWHLITATYNNVDMKIYTNGVLAQTKSFPNIYPYSLNNRNGYIGRRGWGSFEQYFNGSIDEVQIFSKALNQTEITELYEDGYLSHPTPAEKSFRMDEGTGTNTYSSSQMGTALEFDGVNDRVTIPPISSISNGTICAWAKLNSVTSASYLFDARETAGVGYCYFNPTPSLICNGGTHYVNAINTQLAIFGSWALYCNSGIPIDASTSFKIGSASNNGNVHNGTIDEVKIWDRALTQEEIQEEMNANAPVNIETQYTGVEYTLLEDFEVDDFILTGVTRVHSLDTDSTENTYSLNINKTGIIWDWVRAYKTISSIDLSDYERICIDIKTDDYNEVDNLNIWLGNTVQWTTGIDFNFISLESNNDWNTYCMDFDDKRTHGTPDLTNITELGFEFKKLNNFTALGHIYLDNLRLVCPNCDSQLPTFKGRNTGNGRYYRRQRYKAGKSY